MNKIQTYELLFYANKELRLSAAAEADATVTHSFKYRKWNSIDFNAILKALEYL